MTENIVTQKLRDFTIQIRHSVTDAIVGTGIAVSPDGLIVTCAHVVEAAGINPRNSNGVEISVYFPRVRIEDKKRRAIVYKCFPNNDDDVVLLKLTNGPLPLAPEQVAILGTAESSEEHPFRSYGYRRLDHYNVGRAHGTILGCVEPPEDKILLGEPVELDSNQINYGMSGSAVLDIERNLVVGIISETWFADSSGKNENTAWAVDCQVLGFEPLLLPLHDKPLPLNFAPAPKLDIEQAKEVNKTAMVAIQQRVEKHAWNNAPEVVKTWAGRHRLLEHLTNDWLDPKQHVIGLIGFGGEGKSSLARKWLDDVLNDPMLPQPDGIFWWTFIEKQSVDEFLDAALSYISNNLLDSNIITSSHQRTQIIGKMLSVGRYIFVLDGLECMQYSDGDDYGVLRSENLRDLLTYFANPDNKSFCLVASRLPLIDLMPYTTYLHRDVDRLSEEDSRTLLQNLGVKGSEENIKKLIEDWDGHALTLSLLGAFIQEETSGEIKDMLEINTPIEGKPRFENVRRILETYNDILSMAERAFLMLLSLFYDPMDETILKKFIHDKNYPGSLCSPIAELDSDDYRQMHEKLQRVHLLRYSPSTKCYSPHALVKAFYAHLIREEYLGEYQDAVEDIANYYGRIAQEKALSLEKLSDFKPQIDAVRYYCRCKKYDEAYDILYERIDDPDRKQLLKLGAYHSDFNIISEFFDQGNIYSSVQIENMHRKSWILNQVGIDLWGLGHLAESTYFLRESKTISLEISDEKNIERSYSNLASNYISLGQLNAAFECANNTIGRYALQGWIFHLQGKLKASDASFERAQGLIRTLDFSDHSSNDPSNKFDPEISNTSDLKEPHSKEKYLQGSGGIWYVENLRRVGDKNYARQILEENFVAAEENNMIDFVGQCYRLLGDLDSDADDYSSARLHYETALKIARSISNREVLIQALLARGRWLAKHMKDANAAFSDLNEALGYCVESGYRIYEADVRVALGWAYIANGEKEKARQSAERAMQMSNEMGYHWGKVDAEEVLGAISG